MQKKNEIFSKNSKKSIYIDILIISLFLLFSYLIIFSRYNFVIGDSGTYAFKTKLFYEKHQLDIKEQSAMALGQVFLGYIFTLIFGFSLRTLHISAYFAVFLCMIFFYILLLQLKIDRYLALISSLCLFITPITLPFIDWYMTEPYFLIYFFIAINLFVFGFRSGKSKYFYFGAIFSTIALFTRQFAISLSLALILLLIIERKRLKSNFIHILFSAIIPAFSLALFYLISPSVGNTKQLYSSRILFMKRLLNPLFLTTTFLRDTLYTLHYSAFYALPLILILLIGAFIHKEYFVSLFRGKKYNLLISTLFISIGTLIIFFRYKKLMPYLPSIFGIGRITNFLGIKIMETKTASVLLTVFTTCGGIIILNTILEHINWHQFKCYLLGRDNGGEEKIAFHYIYLVILDRFLDGLSDKLNIPM
ncbi:MAG: hypothetical protein ACMUHX_11630 [bacterium]